MKTTALFAAVLALVAFRVAGLDKEGWKGRTIYQVLTDRFARTDGSKQPCSVLNQYCGGTFKGLENNLDYIAKMGFDAIWISPVVDNVEGAYHGYHARNWYEINSHFGTAEELLSLIQKCKERNIAVMFDVVANHVGPIDIDYESIVPFNSPTHYHNYCMINSEDWNGGNQWRVENCRLAGLPDLKQENPWVEATLLAWIKDLVKNYTVDGLRLDTVPEIVKPFWEKFSKAAGVFTIGEVFDGRSDFVKSYLGPIDSVLNYPIWGVMRETFAGQRSFRDLATKIDDLFNHFGNDLNYMGMFVNNHDNPRFLNSSTCVSCFQNAIMFTLFFPGIPIVYYGDEQLYTGGGDPYCREDLWSHMDPAGGIYQKVAKMVAARKKHEVWNYPYLSLHASDKAMVFIRGKVLLAFSGSNANSVLNIERIPLSDGTVLVDLFSEEKITIKGEKASVALKAFEGRIFVPSN